MITAGAAAGFAAAYGISRVLAAAWAPMAQIIGWGAGNPALTVGVPLLLILLGAIACYLPARRASRIVGPDEAARLVPGLATGTIVGAAWCGEDGYFDNPQSIVEALAADADVELADVADLSGDGIVVRDGRQQKDDPLLTGFLLGLAYQLRLVQAARDGSGGWVVRLSPLGRWLLGLADRPAAPPDYTQTLLVQPNLEVIAFQILPAGAPRRINEPQPPGYDF